MGKSSREKGKQGERELAAELRRLGFDTARRAQQYCGTESSADILGIAKVHIECKRCESLSIYKAMQQAMRDAGETQDIPVVMHRRSRQPWLVAMEIEDWAEMYRAYIHQHNYKGDSL